VTASHAGFGGHNSIWVNQKVDLGIPTLSYFPECGSLGLLLGALIQSAEQECFAHDGAFEDSQM
jgi:hypothetical protein